LLQVSTNADAATIKRAYYKVGGKKLSGVTWLFLYVKTHYTVIVCM
jgi:hypothetical protein